MKTWLFTWNPLRWSWDDRYDGYEEMIRQIAQVGKAYATWSCGVNRSIKEGDRVFLIRLGLEPRGIMASGHAATGVFVGPHWDSPRGIKGDLSKRVYIEFDKIIDPVNDFILGMDELKQISPTFCWSSQASRIQIPEEIANEVECIWLSLRQ